MKRVLALAALLLLTWPLAACGGGKTAGLAVEDFNLYTNGSQAQIPSYPFLVTERNDLSYATNRRIKIGDDAKAVAAEYGAIPCDISYEENGAFTTLEAALMGEFVGEAQPRYYTVSYVLLATGGKTYNYNEMEDAPDGEEYTIYHLEFEITDDAVSAILFNKIQG